MVDYILLLPTSVDVKKGFFLYHRKDPVIIHKTCLLWMFRPFYAAELTVFCFGSPNLSFFTCI